jgi:uncharacterized protein (DUF58 family)
MIPSLRLVLLCLAPLAVSLAAVVEPDLVRPMLGMDAAIVALAIADAWMARRRLVEVTREAPPVLSVGRANTVTLHLRSLADGPLDLVITDDLPAPAEGLPAHLRLGPRGQARVQYQLLPTRRGAYQLGDHHLRHPSPLGLWQRQLRFTARQEVRVYPDVKAVRAQELIVRHNRESSLTRSVRLRGGENEFERLRDFCKDDEYRTIDWKATARRQRVIAREYQQERNQTIVCLVDCGRLMTLESGGLSQLDHALNAVLMMSHVAARTGDRLGLVAYDSQVRAFVPPSGGPRATQRLARAVYDLHPRLVEPDHRTAFEVVSRRIRRRALVVLFTQIIDDVAARTVLGLTRSLTPRHLPLCALFRDPAVEALSHTPLAGNDPAPLYVRATAAESVLWQDRLIRDLTTRGALVLHTLPSALTPALIARYLEIKAHQLI